MSQCLGLKALQIEKELIFLYSSRQLNNRVLGFLRGPRVPGLVWREEMEKSSIPPDTDRTEISVIMSSIVNGVELFSSKLKLVCHEFPKTRRGLKTSYKKGWSLTKYVNIQRTGLDLSLSVVLQDMKLKFALKFLGLVLAGLINCNPTYSKKTIFKQ